MTDIETRCDFSDLLVSSCAHCKEAAGLLPAPLRSTARAELPGQITMFGGGVHYTGIPAAFTSWCHGCDTRVEVGDPVCRVLQLGWVHVECATASNEEQI